MTQGLIQPLSLVWRLGSTVNKSPEEEENQYLSDRRINEVVKKAKRKAILTTIPISAVLTGLLAYLKLWWLIIALGGWLLWRIFKK